MRKILFSVSVFLLSAFALPAQLPGSVERNDMVIATTITNAATYTYAGTNYADLTQFGEVGWEFGFQGTNAVSTSNLVQSFKFSMDGTNWLTAPIYYWSNLTALGITAARYGTNWAIGTFNYMKPYQTISPNTNDLTNAFLISYTKGYRRD